MGMLINVALGYKFYDKGGILGGIIVGLLIAIL